MNAPLQTDMLSSFAAATLRAHAIPASLRLKPRESPPGRTRMSGRGCPRPRSPGGRVSTPWLSTGAWVGATVKTRKAPFPAAVKTSIGPAKSRISTSS